MKSLSACLWGLALLLITQNLIAQPTGRRVKINTFSTTQKANLATAMFNYIDKTIIDEHACNTEFGKNAGASGSIHGPELFCNWHRNYLVEMEADPGIQTALSSAGVNLMPRWNPVDGIGIISDFLITDADCATTCGSGTCNNPSGFPNGETVSYIYSNPLPCSTWTDFEDFSEDMRVAYHNMGHKALDGNMGTIKSPATPAFWLWHAMVDDVYWDYQQQCMTNADIHIKDTPADTGAEPNPNPGPMYVSSDIWVRQNQDVPTGGTSIPHGSVSYANEGSHQNPEYKITGDNYVYVRISNDSPQEFSGGILKVYWSKASTGLNWPTTWVNYYDFGVLHGDQLEPTDPTKVPVDYNYVIPNIAAGGQFIMEIPWRVPNPADFSIFSIDIHHFCLLARIVSDFDEMTFPEGIGIGTNTRNNNNIAWKNVSVYDLDPLNIVPPNGGFKEIAEQIQFMGVYVTNPYGEKLPYTLKFHSLLSKEERTILDVGGVVYARLSYDLFKAWDRGGMKGDGLEIIGEDERGIYVQIYSPKAVIYDVVLEGKSNYPLELGFGLTKYLESGQVYNVDVEQSLDRGKHVIGGERYEIRIDKYREDKDFEKRFQMPTSDNLVSDAIAVYPNPSSGFFNIVYTLPEESLVQVALLDIQGRELWNFGEETQISGYHQNQLDITHFAPGVYVLKIQIGANFITKKVVIE